MIDFGDDEGHSRESRDMRAFCWPAFCSSVFHNHLPHSLDRLKKKLRYSSHAAMQETWVQFLGWKDPLEKEMAIDSSILAWKIPRTEEPGGLQSMGSQETDTTERLNHPHKSHPFKACSSVVFSMLTKSSHHYHSPIIEHFHPQRKRLSAHWQLLTPSHYTHGDNLMSVSMDLPVMGNSYK